MYQIYQKLIFVTLLVVFIFFLLNSSHTSTYSYSLTPSNNSLFLASASSNKVRSLTPSETKYIKNELTFIQNSRQECIQLRKENQSMCRSYLNSAEHRLTKILEASSKYTLTDKSYQTDIDEYIKNKNNFINFKNDKQRRY